MSQSPVVTLHCLLRRLEEVLGPDSLLFRRFEAGLLQEDERRLTDAMNSLRLYPADTRRVVEDTVMGWLFGSTDDVADGPRQATPHA